LQTEIWAIGLVIIATIVGALGPVLLKRASGSLTLSIKGLLTNKNLVGGFVLYGLATIFFIPALKGGELSVLYPFVSIAYIWVSLLSMWLLKEEMNLIKWSGIFFIITGVILIGFAA